MPIYKQPGSQFWQYDFRVAGKRYRGSTEQTSATKARQIEAARIHDVSVGGEQALTTPPLLKDFAPRFTAYVAADELAEKTRAYYGEGWRLLSLTDLSHMRCDRITEEAVSSARFPGSGSNANCALRTLRRMLRLAERWNVIRRAPQFSLRKEVSREVLIDPVTEIRMLGAAENATIRDALIVILDTGMRPSEIAAMRWEHVDFVNGAVFVPHGKTRNAKRHVPMSARMRGMLKERAGLDSTFVFPSPRRKGEHIQRQSITQAFGKLRTQLGIDPSLVLYAGRHTFATDYIQHTGNLAKLQRQMGHSSITITQRYMHPDTQDTGKIMDLRNQQRSATAHGEVIQ